MRALCTLVLSSFLVFSTHAIARCSIDEVIELARDGTSAGDIRKQCGAKIDASKCSASRIVGFVQKDKDDDYIHSKCDDSGDDDPYAQNSTGASPNMPANMPARACYTNFGACPMGMPVPVGSPCYCPTPAGPIGGMAR